MSYLDFVAHKSACAEPSGLSVDINADYLKPHQSALVKWALGRGRAAIFADTGLGKTRMQLEYARHISQFGKVLILAPLAVADQTVGEGRDIGIDVTHARDQGGIAPGINITNYERLHKFNPDHFIGVVLDESSCIKHHDTKTLATLLDAFQDTKYKLCATATPAPNDWVELGTHAEFLGIRSRVEMLSEFFVHDGGETQKWRLKGHAKAVFWRWVASWGAMIKSPADLGFDASEYELPPLNISQHMVECEAQPEPGMLFALEASTLSERRAARRDSMDARVGECAERVNGSKRPWVVWCELNAESKAIASKISGAAELCGADSIDRKESVLADFAAGKIRVLVTKPSICGFGLNWQHCRNMAFVGVTDSFESYYQAVRRCWRFGQTEAVNVHLFTSQMEGSVLANLQRKEKAAKAMAESLSAETKRFVMDEVMGKATRESNDYAANSAVTIPRFLSA